MKKIFMAVLFALCTCMPIASAQDVWVFSDETKGYDCYVDDTSPDHLSDGTWTVHYRVVNRESGESIKSDTMCFFIEGAPNYRIRYYDMSQRGNIKTANIYNESGSIYLWLEEWKKNRT